MGFSWHAAFNLWMFPWVGFRLGPVDGCGCAWDLWVMCHGFAGLGWFGFGLGFGFGMARVLQFGQAVPDQ